MPPYCTFDPDLGGNPRGEPVYLNPNFDLAIVKKPEVASCPVAPLDPAAPFGSSSLYRRDLLGGNGDVTDPLNYQLLAHVPIEQFVGASDDFNRVFFLSTENQTVDTASAVAKIYEWEREGSGACTSISPAFDAIVDGCITLISRDTGGAPFSTDSAPASVVARVANYRIPGNATSADGDRFFFYNTAFPFGSSGGSASCGTRGFKTVCDIYARVDNTTTYKVSEPECTVNCGTIDSPSSFMWATSNGQVAFFMNCSKLTDASDPGVTCTEVDEKASVHPSTVKLYRWDENGASGHRLIDLTIDYEPADGTSPTAEAVVGTSDDENAPAGSNAAPGNTVFFVADGQIVAGQPSLGSAAGLYRWTWNAGGPRVDYLASFNNEDIFTNARYQRQRVTPDGRYLLIRTASQLDPVADQDGDWDAYRWSEGEGWRCITCQLPGAVSAGDATVADVHSSRDSALFSPQSGDSGVLKNFELTAVISPDGQRVFFDTPDALVPQDTNGGDTATIGAARCPVLGYPDYIKSCADVYEWHDGRVSLISPGTGQHPSYLLGSDSSGENVAFFTRNKLVGWDVDDNVDIYDARIGGGFPEPPPVPPACEGEACRGAGSAAPSVPGAGSAAFQGPGNQPTPTQTRCPRGKRKVTRNGRTRCVAKKRKRHNRNAKHNRRAAR